MGSDPDSNRSNLSNLSDPSNLSNPSNLSSVPELIDDYRRQEEALRKHERQLDRLRAELATAAGREATAIVMNARAEIRRILITARRELLGLAEQIQVMTESQERSEAAAGMLLGPAPEPKGTGAPIRSCCRPKKAWRRGIACSTHGMTCVAC